MSGIGMPIPVVRCGPSRVVAEPRESCRELALCALATGGDGLHGAVLDPRLGGERADRSREPGQLRVRQHELGALRKVLSQNDDILFVLFDARLLALGLGDALVERANPAVLGVDLPARPIRREQQRRDPSAGSIRIVSDTFLIDLAVALPTLRPSSEI